MALRVAVAKQVCLEYKQDASLARYHAIKQGIWIQGEHQTYDENPVIQVITRFAEGGGVRFQLNLGDLVLIEAAWEYYQANEKNKEPAPAWAEPPVG